MNKTISFLQVQLRDLAVGDVLLRGGHVARRETVVAIGAMDCGERTAVLRDEDGHECIAYLRNISLHTVVGGDKLAAVLKQADAEIAELVKAYSLAMKLWGFTPTMLRHAVHARLGIAA